MLLSLVPFSAAAAPSVEARVRIEPPYVVINLTVRDLPVSKLTFDVGNFSRLIEYAFAVTNGVVAYGSLEGSKLIFQTPASRGDHTLYVVLRSFKYEAYSVIFSIPTPLVPIEALPCNFSFTIYGLPSMPSVIQSPFNVTTGYNESLRYYITATTTAAEEPSANLTFSLSAARLPPAIKKLERTLIIDSQRVTIIDNLTLQGLASYTSDSINLTYPLDLGVEGIGGLLGPYPPTRYSVTRIGNSTRISIPLLAPPSSEGDLAYVWVKLSSPLLSQGNRYMIPAFLGVGYYVQNLTITLKVRGELTGLGSGALEDGYRVYRLPERRLLGVEVDPYVVLEGHLQPPQHPNYLLLSAVIAAFAALGYFMFSRGGRAAPTVASVEVKLTSQLIKVLREREDNLDAFLDSWSKYGSGKLSRQAYRQAVLRYRRREAELRRLAREEAPRSEESLKLLDRVDNLFLEVDIILNRFEELKNSIDKGFITDREGRRKIAELDEKLQRIRDELEELIARYSEA